MNKSTRLWMETGGAGDTTHLLIHGRGATGAVWTGLRDLIDEKRAGRWLIPDLPGHGGSLELDVYSYSHMAAEVAAIADGRGPLIVVGHSLGGVITLALAGGDFGLDIRGVVAFGIKVQWSEEELANAENSAERPVRWYETEEAAMERYLRVTGLDGLVDGTSPYTQRGVRQEAQGFRFSFDNRAGGGGLPPMSSLVKGISVPVVLASGGADQMAPVDDLRPYDSDAVEMPGLVHNAHVQEPAAIWGLIERLL